MNQRKIGVILSYFNKAMSIGINLFYVPLLLFYMGKQEYGLYQLMGSVTAYIGLMDFGLEMTVARFYTEYKAKKDSVRMENLLAMSSLVYIVLGAGIILAGAVVYIYLGDIFSGSLSAAELESARRIFILLVTSILICVETQIFTAVIISAERFIVFQAMTSISVVLQPIIVLLVMQVSPYAYSFVLIQVVFFALNSMFQIYYAFRHLHMKICYHGLDKSMIRSVSSFSFATFLVVLMEQIFFRSNQVVLGILSGTIAVAVYAIGAQIYMSYMPLAGTISGVFFPKVTEMVVLRRPVQELSELFIRIGRIQFLLLGLVLSGFLLFGQQFIQFWVGDSFQEAYWVALFIITPFTFDITQNLAYTSMQARNDIRFKVKVGLVTGSLNILLVIPAAHMAGGVGCAAVTGILLFLGNCVTMDIYYSRVLKLDILGFWRNILQIGLVILAAMGLYELLGPMMQELPLRPVQVLAGQIVFYTCLYLSIIGRFAMNDYERGIFLQGLKKLGGRFKKKVG